jgi:hypothetical protein
MTIFQDKLTMLGRFLHSLGYSSDLEIRPSLANLRRFPDMNVRDLHEDYFSEKPRSTEEIVEAIEMAYQDFVDSLYWVCAGDRRIKARN